MIVSDWTKKIVMDQEGWTRKMFEAGIEMRKNYGPQNVYDFSLGNPDIEPPTDLTRRLIESLNDPTPGKHRYMQNNGYEDVRADVAAYLEKRTGLPFTSLHVFMTNGCAGALNILRIFSIEGSERLVHPFITLNLAQKELDCKAHCAKFGW